MAKLLFDNTAYVWPDVSFNKSHWIIYIQLYKKNKKIQIKKRWITSPAELSGVIAKYSTISWMDGGRPTSGKHETIVRHGKQGRNVLQQAIAEVSAKYKKHKEKHSTNLIPPTLLRVFDDYPTTYFEDMDEDFYCQRKYNGTRCLAMYTNGEVKLYSRKLHIYKVPEISAELLDILKNNKSVMIDGELYIHKTPLQIISGIVRGSDYESKKELQYIVFDIYDIARPTMNFSDRFAKLKSIFSVGRQIKIAPTYKLGKSRPIKTFLERIAQKYKEFLAEGYEGMVIRRDLPYEPGYHEKHTDRIFKHKPIRTKEFEIIDYTDGRGKDKGKLIWICRTKDGKKFSVRPKMSADKRAELYRKFNTPAEFRKYKGKQLTIEFDNLSIDGVPQQPRGVIIRDYE